jgi:hypothetical protein
MTMLFAAMAALIQTTQPAPLNVIVPEVNGVTADPTCGGREAIARQAFCIATTQASAETVVGTFTSAFEQQGWVAADGRENVIVYVKRKAEGGCDAFQLIAFAEYERAPAPAAPAYIALATIPGDICRAAESATPAAPAR